MREFLEKWTTSSHVDIFIHMVRSSLKGEKRVP